MSFLRRVLARAQGAAGPQPPRAYAFARELEPDAAQAAPDSDVGEFPQFSRTPETSSSPLVAPRSALVHDAGPRTEPTPSAHEPSTASSSSVHTHTVERVERSIPQPSNTAATVHPVYRPIVERTNEHTVEVEHHHIHHDESRPAEKHTQRVEHHQRLVVQTTTPQAAPSDRVRALASASRTQAGKTSPVAAPRTVHVNIGRIVVSAESPAAKPHTPVAAAAVAKSLTEILAAKKGRS